MQRPGRRRPRRRRRIRPARRRPTRRSVRLDHRRPQLEQMHARDPRVPRRGAGSVQENRARSAALRRASIRVRSSVKWTARTGVNPGTIGSSLNGAVAAGPRIDRGRPERGPAPLERCRGGRPEFALRGAKLPLSAGPESGRPASPSRSGGWTTSDGWSGSPLPAVLPAVSRSARRFVTRSDPQRPPISPTNTGFPGFSLNPERVRSPAPAASGRSSTRSTVHGAAAHAPEPAGRNRVSPIVVQLGVRAPLARGAPTRNLSSASLRCPRCAGRPRYRDRLGLSWYHERSACPRSQRIPLPSRCARPHGRPQGTTASRSASRFAFWEPFSDPM